MTTPTIKIDFESNTPVYKQIVDQIISAIARGELKEGDKLPSIRKMASMLQINMLTVNKAYNYLVEQGFVTLYKKQYVVKLSNKEEKWKKELERAIDLAIASNAGKDQILDKVKELLNMRRGLGS